MTDRGSIAESTFLGVPVVATPPAQQDWAIRPTQGLRLHHYLLAFLLLGYMMLDKGFAYIRLPGVPLYIGDIVCLASLAWIALFVRPLVRWSLRDHGPLLLMLLYAAIRLLPDLQQYGLEALRDSVVLTYGYVAVFGGFMFRDRTDLQFWLRLLGISLLAHTFLTPVFLLISFSRDPLTLIRAEEVPLLLFKPADHCNFAGLAITFFIVARGLPLRVSSPLPVTVAVWNLVYVALTLVRGAYLGLGAVLAQLFVFGYARRLMVISLACILIGTSLLVVDPVITFGKYTFSMDVLIEEVESIFIDRPYKYAMVGTKEWRLDFWRAIITYNTRHLQTFLVGVGNGPNLAVLHGFAHERLNEPRILRSPHSAEMTIFARFGFIGILLWFLVHFHYYRLVISALRRARRSGLLDLRLGLWVSLAYVSMTLINASFDVMLESPQTAIWYWFMIGTGITLSRLIEDSLKPALP